MASFAAKDTGKCRTISLRDSSSTTESKRLTKKTTKLRKAATNIGTMRKYIPLNLKKPNKNQNKVTLLSKELKVATEIYRSETKNELIWYNKLVKELESEVSKNTISKALENLLKLGIVESEYGETELGKPGKLLRISSDSEELVSALLKLDDLNA